MGLSLLSLPPEIRAEILSHLVVVETVIEPFVSQASWSRKKLSTKVLRTCKEVYAEAVHLLYHRNTFLFCHGLYLEEFSTNIGPSNLATLRDLRIILYPIPRSLQYRRTELAKYDINQEEVWDGSDCDDNIRYGGSLDPHILSFLFDMMNWTFALPKLPKNARDITIYTSSSFPVFVQTALPSYDDPIISYFLGPDILGHFFEELYSCGAKINWIPGTNVAYRFTGRILTFEDVRRLQHEIVECCEALRLQSLPSGGVMKCIEHQEVSLIPFRGLTRPHN